MGRTPKSKGSSTVAASSSFLNQLTTLRGYIASMGMNHTEAQMSAALRNSGYNVEIALERLLTGGEVANGGASTSASSMSTNASMSTSASMSKKRSSCTPAKRSSMKRMKPSPSTPHPQTIPPSTTTISNRLLLCKRWTVACSKTIRGQISHGETCCFDENYKHQSPPVNNNNTAATKKVMDPMVRFRTKRAEGTLNKYLCEILGPLLRLSATNTEHYCNTTSGVANASNGGASSFVPMIHVTADALMEDHHLIIGSDIPINLKIYLNDPLGFFELFHQCQDVSASRSESSQFFGRKNGGTSSGAKKGKQYEVMEAAFRLLQWAERGEEIDYGTEDNKGGGVQVDLSEMKDTHPSNGKRDDDMSSTSSTTKELLDNTTSDGDYEEEQLESSEEVNELNQLVANGKNSSKSIPELSDPIGFKENVVLRPYQRQALYWMCRREGLTLKQLDLEGEEDVDTDEELTLLAELAESSHSFSSHGSNDMQVWGGAGIACDCGPVVVEDEDISRPLIDYGKKVQEKKRNYVHHPLWKRRFLATEDMTAVYAFYVNELLEIASASPPNPPRQCVGGILADAMGLGKTVMLMSLILKSKSIELGDSKDSIQSETTTDLEVRDEDSDENDEKDGDYTDGNEVKPKEAFNNTRAKSCGTTLVIAPLSLISQWEEEMATKTNLTAIVYYDNSSKKLAREDSFSSVDVVVTTYGTIQSEYAALSRANKNGGSKEPGANQPLLSMRWKRVILDEAHGIKNPSTVVSKACCMIRAESRWCVTGTPIQNSLQDVYGLLKFLRHEPWCEASFWKNAITSAIPDKTTGQVVIDGKVAESSPMKGENGAPDAMSVAFGRVRRVLAPIILRRTKDTLAEDGKPILTLPPIESSVVKVILTSPEREFYNALLQKSQSVFDGFVKAGTASKSWFAIFSLLQRLRQSCNHVSLTVQNRFDTSDIDTRDQNDDSAQIGSSDGAVSNKFLTDLLSKFKKTCVEGNEKTSFAKEVAAGLTQSLESSQEYLTTECPICFDEPKIVDAVHTPCAHMFCKSCLIDEFLEQRSRSKKYNPQADITGKKKATSQSKVEGGECPVCNTFVQVCQVIQVKKTDAGELVSTYLNETQYEKENMPCALGQQRNESARETLESALMKGASSSKLEAILKELDDIWTKDPGSKILIFSQFLGFLDIIARALNHRDIVNYRIDGKMSLKERVKMIDKFNKDSQSSHDFIAETDNCQRGSVFLVSMKAGGCGLNLVAASTVFIIDPWWNQAIEDQCINRIHRIGQQAKLVRVRKFVVEDSVEEKIVKLQMKKKSMANDILDSDGSGQLESSKPTLEDFKLIFGS